MAGFIYLGDILIGYANDTSLLKFYYIPSEGLPGDPIEFTFEDGMTWADFCDSEYNNNNRYVFWIDDEGALYPINGVVVNIDQSGDEVLTYSDDTVYGDDLIIADELYVSDNGGGETPEHEGEGETPGEGEGPEGEGEAEIEPPYEEEAEIEPPYEEEAEIEPPYEGESSP